MITNDHVEKFIEQARRYGNEKWMLQQRESILENRK